MAGAEQGVRVRVAPDVEPADARNGSERAESVGNERVKTASPSQACATRANRHVTKAAGLVSTPRGTQPLAGNGRVTPLPRSDSPRPFVTARVLVGKESYRSIRLLVLFHC